MKIIVGARKSPVSLVQCRTVANLLQRAGAEVELRPVETAADSLEAALPEGGGSEVFVKEVDEALLRGEIDVAVHDMKDVGPHLTKGASIAAVPHREEARFGFISAKSKSLSHLAQGSRVGVSSQVAHVQLARLRRDVVVVPMAPEIEGLLRALKNDELEAFLVPACDMIRMKFAKLIAELISIDRIIPCVGQGALSVQVRGVEKDLLRYVNRACHHNASGLRIRAERGFLKAASAQEGAVSSSHAEIKPSGLTVIGFLSGADASNLVIERESGELDKAKEVGERLARKLFKKYGA